MENPTSIPIWFAVFFTVFGNIYDFITRRLTFGFWLYQLKLNLFKSKAFGTIVYSKNPIESQKMLFNIHQLHRKYTLNTDAPLSLGFESSVNKSTSVPADAILSEYLHVGCKHIDKRYFTSEDLLARRERIKEVLTDKYLGVLFDYQIDGFQKVVFGKRKMFKVKGKVLR